MVLFKNRCFEYKPLDNKKPEKIFHLSGFDIEFQEQI